MLKSLEDILAGATMTDHRLPDAEGGGGVLQAIPDATGTNFKFKFVDPAEALLAPDQIDKLTADVKKAMLDELDKLKAEIVKVLSTPSSPVKKE